MKSALHGLLPAELEALCLGLGEPAFRARQLWQWLQVRHALDWATCTNLPKRLTAALDAADWSPTPLVPLRTASDPSGTAKWLFRLLDGETVETVHIPSAAGHTVCVSTQVGCRMGCAFCATAKSGFARSLSPGEIVAQVHAVARALACRPDHVVFMGMGEPFDNYDATLRAARLINHPDGLDIGARKITISTCGVVPGIQKLAGEGLQLELSVSLHAPNPDIRRRLMPVERRWPMPELLDACAAYTAKTKRIVTFEYTLVRGLNDAPSHAEELASRLSAFPCRVNLIPLSPVPEFPGKAPSRTDIRRFLDVLARRRVPATLRDSKGSTLSAACGQLRRAAPAEAK